MKINLHHISSSTLVAIYTGSPSAAAIHIPVVKPEPASMPQAPSAPKLNLNFEDDNVDKGGPRINKGFVDSVAIKVLAIMPSTSKSTTLKFSNLHEIHGNQGNINLKDFADYYNLLRACASFVYLSASSVLADVKSYCIIDLDAGKVGFYYSPIQGVQSLLLSLDLYSAQTAAEATNSLLTDLNESANRNEALYLECNEKLVAAERDGHKLAEKLHQLVDRVDVRETQLFQQFVLLLNEKKKKIRELLEEIEDLKTSKGQVVDHEMNVDDDNEVDG